MPYYLIYDAIAPPYFVKRLLLFQVLPHGNQYDEIPYDICDISRH